MSMEKTRFRRCIHVMGASGLSGAFAVGWCPGTMCSRSLQFGVNTPWKRVRLSLGRGTKAASRAMKSSGSSTTCVVPSRSGFTYSPEEQRFAEAVHRTLGEAALPLGTQSEVQPFVLRQGRGSTDVGDVSWAAPTVGFSTATWVPGTPAHSWQAVAAGGTSIGHKGMLLAARLLALTATDLFRDTELIKRAWAELREKRGADFEYEALLGDRTPPLDYRL